MSKSHHEPRGCFQRGSYEQLQERVTLQFWDGRVYDYSPVSTTAWEKFLDQILCLGCEFNRTWRRHMPPEYLKLAAWPAALLPRFYWDNAIGRYFTVPPPP